MSNASSKHPSSQKSSDSALSLLLEANPVEHALGTPEEQNTIKRLYKEACQFYKQEEFAEAAALFVLLTSLSPYERVLWIGLGLCEKQRKQYAAALTAYDMAAWADEKDPIPFIYAADCYLMIKGKQDALQALAAQSLDKAIQRARQHEKYHPLMEDALKRRARL